MNGSSDVTASIRETKRCGSSGEKILSADMGRVFLEYRAQLTQPELKAITNGPQFAGVPVRSAILTVVTGAAQRVAA